MAAVPSVQEESLTEYLLWKWAEADPHFHFLRASLFTKSSERTTGADFELELWLIGRKVALPLLFQAKVLKKPFNSYARGFNYPNNSGRQLRTLLGYAKAHARVPLYVLYGTPAAGWGGGRCPVAAFAAGAVFVADAYEIEGIANSPAGSRVSKDEILGRCNPFHCFVCCALTTADWPGAIYFRHYFPNASSVSLPFLDEGTIPSYANFVQRQIDGVPPDFREFTDSSEHLSRIRYVAVYDVRR